MQLTSSHTTQPAPARSRPRLPRAMRSIPAAVAVTVALLIGGATIPAIALAGSSPVTFYACVTAKTGALKIVSKSARCAAGQHKISWNNIGPRGARGARGPRGPQGPRGVVDGYLGHATQDVQINDAGEVLVASLKLPAGKFQVTADVGLTLNATNPVPDAVFCTLLDSTRGLADDQGTTITADAIGTTAGELTLLGDTAVGGTVKVQCMDDENEALTQVVTIQAIPITSIVAPSGARHSLPLRMRLHLPAKRARAVR